MEKGRIRLSNLIGTAFFLAALICLVRSVSLCFSIDIWYDELFSVEFASRPFSELVSLTSRDVHPPLYYLILRLFRQIFIALGLLGDGAGQLPYEVLCKLISVLPFILILLYSVTTVRRHFGLLQAGAFSFAIMAMPQMPEYTTEIRMYSYAMFFVTAQMLHGYALVRDFLGEGKKSWDIPNGAAMFVYSVAAAYTHYYAALSAGIVYGLFFVWMLVAYLVRMKADDAGDSERRSLNYKAFGLLVIIMNLMMVSYVPWIGVLRSQASSVKENYWILPVGLHTLLSAAKHLFEGYFGSDTLSLVCGCAFVFLIAALFVRTVIRVVKTGKREDIFTICSFLVLVLLVGAGMAASIILRPVFVNRYMIPAYGCFWLSVCIMASKELELLEGAVSKGKASGDAGTLFGVMGALLLALIVVVGITDYKTFIWNENYRKTEMEKTLALFEDIDPDAVIISNFDQVQGLLGYYLNRNESLYRIYLYQEEPEELITEMVPGLESLYDPVDIRNYLDGGKKVMFFGSFNSREDILLEWKDEMGIESDDLGSFLMERYWFENFRLRDY